MLESCRDFSLSFLEMDNIYMHVQCCLVMNGRIDEAPVVLQVLDTNVDAACSGEETSGSRS